MAATRSPWMPPLAWVVVPISTDFEVSAEQATRTGQALRDVVGRELCVERSTIEVRRAPEDRLEGVVQGEPGELLAVVHQERHGRDQVAVDATIGLGRGANLDGLRGLG